MANRSHTRPHAAGPDPHPGWWQARARINAAVVQLDERMAELHDAADVLAGMIAATPAGTIDGVRVQLELLEALINDASGGEPLDEETASSAVASVTAALPRLAAGH